MLVLSIEAGNGSGDMGVRLSPRSHEPTVK